MRLEDVGVLMQENSNLYNIDAAAIAEAAKFTSEPNITWEAKKKTTAAITSRRALIIPTKPLITAILPILAITRFTTVAPDRFPVRVELKTRILTAPVIPAEKDASGDGSENRQDR